MKTNNKIKLEDIGNKLPFKVPENYFENFATQIEGQIVLKPVSVINLIRPWMYIAAMFLGVFFIGRFAYITFQQNKISEQEKYDLYLMSQLDEKEITQYYLADED